MSEQNLDYDALVSRCQSIIKVGSKSFSLSAHLFGKEKRDGAFLLYSWCRFCDDEIDKASLTETPAQLEKRLDGLRERTEASYGASPMSHPVFAAFQYVARRYDIPKHYPFELLEGMAMDIRKEEYPDLNKLLLYSYRVAGTVGLMMSHVMGLNDDKALQKASDMGTAMQLTNISRDVFEDADMGRVYLPGDWLKEARVAPSEIKAPKNRKGVVQVVTRLLDVADNYYRTGDDGLRNLSFRCACTVASARYVYAEIGNQVRRRGIHAWDTRTWVRLPRKLWVMLRGILRVCLQLPSRWKFRWQSNPIQQVWRHALWLACPALNLMREFW